MIELDRFTVRIEYEKMAEWEVPDQLVLFALNRVLMECERRDFPTVGRLEVKQLPLDREGGFPAQPVLLIFQANLDDVLEKQEEMRNWRKQQGIDESERLEA